MPTFFSRNDDFFYVPFTRIEARKNSPLMRSMNVFNKISNQYPNIDISLSSGKFKRSLYDDHKKVRMSGPADP